MVRFSVTPEVNAASTVLIILTLALTAVALRALPDPDFRFGAGLSALLAWRLTETRIPNGIGSSEEFGFDMKASKKKNTETTFAMA